MTAKTAASHATRGLAAKLLIISIGLLAAAVAALAPLQTPAAFAASAYDNAIAIAEELKISSPSCGDKIDGQSGWSFWLALRDAADNQGGAFEDSVDRIETAMGNGSTAWAIVDTGNDSGAYPYNGTYVNIAYIAEETGDPLNWSTSGGGRVNVTPPIQQLKFGFKHQSGNTSPDPCELQIFDNWVSGSSINQGFYVSWPTFVGGGTSIKVWLVAGFDLNYPEDYEGPEIPGTGPEPATSGLKPNFNYSQVEPFKIQITDTNFGNFDAFNPPVLCADGFLPNLKIEIREDEILVPGGEMDAQASAAFFYQHEMDYEAHEFEIKAWYHCLDESITFTGVTVDYFKFTSSGLLDWDLFVNCFTEDFPFINIGACMENMLRIAQLASFGFIKFIDMPELSGCRQLVVLNTWIPGTTGKTYCPAFSSEVRNVVTPFITVFLAMLGVGGIVGIYGNRKGET